MANETVNRYLNVYIQSGDAQAVYDRLIAKQKQLNEQLAGNPKNAEKLKQQLAALEEPISRAAKKLSGELTPSFRDTQVTVNNLANRLRRMSTEDADFSKVLAQYKQANKELEEQRTKVGFLGRAMRSFWQEAKTVAVGVIVGNTIQSALQTVLGYVTGIVSGSAKIADELSDIEKTTNLTNEQVRQLNTELGRIDTRTSRSELRELASEAGKLGEDSVEGIRKFVEEADKIKVALGEDLGEDALINVAKAAKIYNVELLNVASAINEIGARSEASESFSVDFLKRLAGTAPTVKLAADEVLGYSAALEIAGQTAEVSTTALNTFFLDFVADIDKFGKAAGFAKGELKTLLETEGTNSAFLQFLERLRETAPTADVFINKLRDLGIDGARGSNVMLALSNNIKTVREQQLIANKAIQSSDSIMNEFNKKNNNAAAELAKLKKEIAGIFQSSTFQQAGESAIRLMRNFIEVIRGIPEFIKENQTALSLLITGLVLMNKQYLISAAVIVRDTAARIINTVVTKGSAVATTLAATAQAAYITITNLLIGRITVATAAQRLWNIAMSLGAGPLGLLVVATGALVFALNNLLGSTKKLTAEQRVQAELSERIATATSDEEEVLRQKVVLINDEVTSLDQKKKILNEIIALSPKYLEGLTLENIKTAEGQALLDRYIASLREKASIEAKSALLSEKLKSKVQLDLQLDAAAGALPRNALDAIKDGVVQKITGNSKTSEYLKLLGDQKKISDEIGILQKDIDTNNKKNVEGLLQTGNQLVSTTEKVAGLSKEAKKAAEDIAKLIQELQQIAFDLLPEGADKDVKKLQRKYDALRERAQGNNKLLIEIQRLYEIELEKLVEEYAQKAVEDARKRDAKKQQEEEERLKKSLERRKILVSEFQEALNKSLDAAENVFKEDAAASREIAFYKARGKERLQLQKEQLGRERDAEIAAARQKAIDAGLTEENIQNTITNIKNKYREKEKEADLEYFRDLLNNILVIAQFAADRLNTLTQLKADKENAELERDRAINEKKKRNLDNRLKAGTISQQQYDREVQRLEKEQEKREKEARRRQFERDKKSKLVQATISGFAAVQKTLEIFGPPIPPNILGIAAMAFTVGTTIAQIASIAKSKPPEYAKGGKLHGPSHQDKSKGMPVLNPYTRQVQAYVEGGEAIVNKRTMADGTRYRMEGTPSQIISWLNASRGGVHWESGAKVLAPVWTTYKAPAMDFPKIKRYYAEGGVIGSVPKQTAETEAKVESNANNLLLLQALESIQLNNASMQVAMVELQQTLANIQNKGIKAYTLISDQEREQKRLNAIREDATMRG